MGEMKWTKDQQKVIDLRDSNILVSAAAGSGKTAVLVERIIQEVTQDEHPIDIDRLLVVTFTKAAAAEMRQRVGRAMENALTDRPGDKRLQRQLSLLHNAQITTIDSFCQNIIRNYFHVIDLDPVFRVADDTEIKIMKQEVLEEVLEECYERAANAPEEQENIDYIAMADMLSTGRDDSAIEALVLSMYDMAQSAPWPSDWLDQAEGLYLYENVDSLREAPWLHEMEQFAGDMIRGYLAQACRTLRVCETEGPFEYSSAIQSDIEQLEMCAQETTFEGYADKLCNYLNKARLASSKANKELRENIQGMRKSYMDNGIMQLRDKYFGQTLEELWEQLHHMAPAMRGLVQTTRRFTQAFAARKRDEGVLDFDDMEHFALEILVDHEHDDVPSEVAKELQEYYQEIMIDEYQDSSYIQEALLSSISRADQGMRPYLFMVGDVKQSIYRFRQARPELFNSKYEAYGCDPEMGQRIDLHQNFRSREMVLASANFLFDKVMQKCLGGIVYDEEASLVPGAAFPENEHRTAGKSEVLLIQENKSFLDRDSMEISVIGEKIRQMVQGEDPLYVFDDDGYRPVCYRDIVILLRSPSRVSDKYIEVLSSMGIPAYCETKTGYFSSMEVELILDFLRVLDNPRQDIPLAAVLRSVLGGFTDNELAEIGVDKEGINYYDALMRDSLSDATKKKVSDFWDMVTKYRERAGVLPVYDLLQQIYRETGYYNIMAAMPAGEKRAANLDLLLQRALEYAGKGNHGIFSFVRYIESMKKSEIDFGEASLTNEGMNAVRIMSIHKSKGLEFPVVFLAGTARQFNQVDARGVVKDNDYGMGIDYINLEDRYKMKTILKNYLADRSVAGSMAEEIRVLYVALTRAKELLIITGTSKDLEKDMAKWQAQPPEYGLVDLIGAKSFLAMLMPLITDVSAQPYFAIETWDSSRLTTQAAEEMAEDILSYEDLKHWESSVCYDEEIRDEICAEEAYVYPYEAEQNVPVKISVTELKRLELQARQMEEVVWVDSELPEGGAAEGIRMPDLTQIEGNEESEPAQSGAEEKADLPQTGEAKKRDLPQTGENTEETNGISDIPRPRFLAEKEQLSGAQRGTVYHLVFEHLPYGLLDEHSDASVLERWLQSFASKGYLTPQELAVIRADDFIAFLRTDIGRRMRAAALAGKLQREQQFMMGFDADKLYPEVTHGDMVLVQGIIDAWFWEDDEIVLVDYKTDHVRNDLRELADKYRIQLEYYAEALERVTGHAVREKIIYSVRKRDFIRV